MARALEGYVLVKEKIPYTAKGVDNLLMAMKRILTDNPSTQKIVMEVDVGHILIEKLVPKDVATSVVSWHDAVRQTRMEEYVPPDVVPPPMKQVWEAIALLHAEGYELSHVLVGNKTYFQKWLGARIPATKPCVFGTPVSADADVPEDVYILCGSFGRESDPIDVEFSVKGVML